MIKRADKKAQELSIATLILIVIGIIVLVLVVLGFTMGWSDLRDKINIFGGGGVTLDDAIQACRVNAVSGKTVAYCDEFRTVTMSDKSKQLLTCQYSGIENVLRAEGKTLSCGTKTAKSVASAKCIDLGTSATTDTKVNGIDCTTITNPAQEIPEGIAA